jgi:hypothetical protein
MADEIECCDPVNISVVTCGPLASAKAGPVRRTLAFPASGFTLQYFGDGPRAMTSIGTTKMTNNLPRIA